MESARYHVETLNWDLRCELKLVLTRQGIFECQNCGLGVEIWINLGSVGQLRPNWHELSEMSGLSIEILVVSSNSFKHAKKCLFFKTLVLLWCVLMLDCFGQCWLTCAYLVSTKWHLETLNWDLSCELNLVPTCQEGHGSFQDCSHDVKSLDMGSLWAVFDSSCQIGMS